MGTGNGLFSITLYHVFYENAMGYDAIKATGHGDSGLYTVQLFGEMNVLLIHQEIHQVSHLIKVKRLSEIH